MFESPAWDGSAWRTKRHHTPREWCHFEFFVQPPAKKSKLEATILVKTLMRPKNPQAHLVATRNVCVCENQCWGGCKSWPQAGSVNPGWLTFSRTTPQTTTEKEIFHHPPTVFIDINLIPFLLCHVYLDLGAPLGAPSRWPQGRRSYLTYCHVCMYLHI